MNPAIIVVAAVLLLAGKWEVPAIFQKEPPTKQLVEQQQALADAKAAQATAEAKQAAAEAKLAGAEAQRQAKLQEQLDYTQQMSLGTDLAIQKIPLEQRSPEVKIAAEFSARTVAGFEAARGKLSPQQRAEIDGLFSTAMAAKDAEVATLRKSLVDKDAALQTTTQEKITLETKVIPGLKQDVTTAKGETQIMAAKVEVVAAKVDAKVAEVATYANSAAAEKAKNGSLEAYVGNLVRGGIAVLLILGLAYYVVHFGLPNLAQEFPASGWLQKAAKAAKSIASSHL